MSQADVGSICCFTKQKISIVPFTAEYMEEARVAWRIYGKGNHSAGVNICDCCAYALARVSGDKLLFKGNDFAQTDVAQVIPRHAEALGTSMKIDLGRTYYRQGFFNVSVEYDHLFESEGTNGQRKEMVPLGWWAEPRFVIIFRKLLAPATG